MSVPNKFLDKARRDPLVPVGCAATVACLAGGLYTFFRGHANLSQRMMRARVVAQGATIVVLLVGSVLAPKLLPDEEKRPRGMTPIEFKLMQQDRMKEAAAQAEASAQKS